MFACAAPKEGFYSTLHLELRQAGRQGRRRFRSFSGMFASLRVERAERARLSRGGGGEKKVVAISRASFGADILSRNRQSCLRTLTGRLRPPPLSSKVHMVRPIKLKSRSLPPHLHTSHGNRLTPLPRPYSVSLAGTIATILSNFPNLTLVLSTIFFS